MWHRGGVGEGQASRQQDHRQAEAGGPRRAGIASRSVEEGVLSPEECLRGFEPRRSVALIAFLLKAEQTDGGGKHPLQVPPGKATQLLCGQCSQLGCSRRTQRVSFSSIQK